MGQSPGFEDQRPVVVVTSDEPWTDVWHTQLHYAAQLSKHFNVIFLGPPEKWSIGNFFSFRINSKVINKNLIVFSYFNWMPAFIGNLAVWLNDKVNSFLIFRSVGDSMLLAVWHFDRYRGVYFFKGNSATKHIYHVIDPVANLNFDNYLARNADLVISVSRRFMEHYLKLNPNVVFEGQGWDAESVKGLMAGSRSLNLHNGSILLLGTFLDDVDYELLIQLRLELPAPPMVLIGPDKTSLSERKALFAKLVDMPNVFWLGPLPPEKHMPYIASCGVCLIAYELTGKVFNRKRVFGTPLKVLPYLGCHKNVVSNIDCEIPELEGKAIYYETTAPGFVQKVRQCLEGDIMMDSILIDQYLEAMDYEKIIKRVFQKIGLQSH